MADIQMTHERAADRDPPMSGAARRWNADYQAWRRARLDRVQASARVWLGVLTTILGLLGSVVLFKGGSLVTGVTSNGWWQAALILLVGAVFAAAVLAVIAGGAATWGGLKDIRPSDQVSSDKLASAGTARTPAGQDAPGEQEAPAGQETPGEHEEPGSAGGTDVLDDRQRRAWHWQGTLLRLGLVIAGTPKGQRAHALGGPEPETANATGRNAKRDWELYQDDIVLNANRNRIYLHASRVLGVLAAALIAALAIVAVIAATVAPVPPSVIVVDHGRVSCGPVKDYAKATGVTQVTAVSNC